MRKILLPLLVIFGFIGYAWYVHLKGIAQPAIIAAKKIEKSKNTLSPTATSVSPTPTSSVQISQSVSAQPTATQQPIQPTATPQPQGQYKDGTYTGSVADAFYGPL